MKNNFLTYLKEKINSLIETEAEVYNYTEDDLIFMLKPYDINHEKIRLGPKMDGGYVCSEFVLNNCSALFTYGVGSEIRYEVDFVTKYQKPAYLFDHTSEHMIPNINNYPLMTYCPEGLGFGDKCNDFIEHIKRFKIKSPVLLKIDIEGGEYEYFKKVDMLNIKNWAMGLLIEIHWIDNTDWRPQFIEIYNRIAPYFVLHHIHGNIWGGGTFGFKEEQLPNVVELSFVNKKYVNTMKDDLREYPIEGLDYSNDPRQEDIKLDFLKRI
jgi:hypothetical protein